MAELKKTKKEGFMNGEDARMRLKIVKTLRASHKKRYILVIFVLIFLFIFSFFCSQRPDPRKIVIEFIKAVASSDSVAVLNYVDFDQLTKEKLSFLAPEEKEKVFNSTKNQLLNNVLRDGTTRVQWENYKKVIANSQIEADTAEVEVTFMHIKTGAYKYTKMKLYLKDGKWKIFYYED
jgi:uncharacterized membrane protein YvbJ